MSLEKVTVKEIRFMDGDDTRIYFSNHTQLVGVTSVSCKVSTEAGQAEYVIKGTIHNFNNAEPITENNE
jgi:putative component of toxin-antitoxin plasmid stabilization module